MTSAPTHHLVTGADTGADTGAVLRNLRLALETRGWTDETSADPDNWSPTQASYGQCAVSALIVQDLLGGDLLRCAADGVSHYYNLLDSGESVDLTRDQFPTYVRFTTAETRSREYVLSYEATARRYRMLSDRVRGHVAP